MFAARAVLALLVAAMLAPNVQAAYEDLNFTEIFTDPAGDVLIPGADILSLAAGEPGDGTIVFRLERDAGGGAGPPSSTFDIFMDGDFRNGWDASGVCDAPPFTGGEPDENYWYCVLPYDAVGAIVGSTLTGILARAYVGVVQDYAPDDGVILSGVESIALGGGAGEYQVVGCTLVVGCVVAPTINVTDLGTVEEALPDGHTMVEHAFTEHTTGTFVYAWNNQHDVLPIAAAAEVTNGTVRVSVADEFSLELFDFTTNTTADDSIRYENAYIGPHIVLVEFDAFQGTLSIELGEEAVEPHDEETHDDHDSEPRDNRQNAFGTEEEDRALPAPGLFLALLALVGGAFVARRQRRS